MNTARNNARFVGVMLGLAFMLLAAAVGLGVRAQQEAEGLAVQFHKSSLNAEVQALRTADQVETQLEDIITRGKADVELSSAVRSILCDSLIFDEQSSDKKVVRLAKAMVHQSCAGVTIPKS